MKCWPLGLKDRGQQSGCKLLREELWSLSPSPRPEVERVRGLDAPSLAADRGGRGALRAFLPRFFRHTLARPADGRTRRRRLAQFRAGLGEQLAPLCAYFTDKPQNAVREHQA